MDSQFPITPRAKKAIAAANRIAVEHGHTYIGSEHIFLALLDEDQPAVQRILEGCGLSPKDFRSKAAENFKAYNGTTQQTPPDLQEIATALRKLADSLG